MSDVKVLKILVRVRTDKVGSDCKAEIEVDAEEWEDMNAQERDELCRNTVFEMIEWGYEVVS